MSDIIDRYKSGERDFTQENLFRENLAGVVLTGSVLVEANCCEANFEKADLSYCDLRRVNFHKANLRGANLTGSDLSQANLCEADTTDAVFDDTNLHQANLYLTKGREQAERVGNLSERTLTQTAAEIEAAVSGSELTIYRGDTWSATLTGLGDISARSKLYFTLKSSNRQTDAESLVQIEEASGLVVLNGVAITGVGSLNGSITVDDETDGDVTLVLTATVTAQLECAEGLLYDIQVVNADGTVDTLTTSTATVAADVTRAVS